MHVESICTRDEPGAGDEALTWRSGLMSTPFPNPSFPRELAATAETCERDQMRRRQKLMVINIIPCCDGTMMHQRGPNNSAATAARSHSKDQASTGHQNQHGRHG